MRSFRRTQWLATTRGSTEMSKALQSNPEDKWQINQNLLPAFGIFQRAHLAILGYFLCSLTCIVGGRQWADVTAEAFQVGADRFAMPCLDWGGPEYQNGRDPRPLLRVTDGTVEGSFLGERVSLLRLLTSPLVLADWKPETWDGRKNVKSIKINLLSVAECLRGPERLRESRRDATWRKMRTKKKAKCLSRCQPILTSFFSFFYFIFFFLSSFFSCLFSSHSPPLHPQPCIFPPLLCFCISFIPLSLHSQLNNTYSVNTAETRSKA